MYCTVGYGSIEARPGWTTATGIIIWLTVAGAIKKTCKAKQSANDLSKEN